MSGFVLAATFFLPAVTRCNSPLVPAEEAYELINDGWDSYANPWPDYVRDLLGGFGMYVAAYLLGTLMAIGAVARLLRSQRVVKAFSIAIAGLIIVACVILISAILIEFMINNPPPGFAQMLRDILNNFLEILAFFLVPLLVPVVILVYLLFSIRLRHRAFVCHMFVGSLMAFLWFGYWFVLFVIQRDALYGLYLSFAASVVLLIAVVGEAKVLTRQSWRRTVWQLLTCRLRDADWTGRCPACDYYLFGLTEMRCPECGRPFTFEELGVSPQELGHQPAGVQEIP